jgi:hypothetical protein
MRFAKMLSAVFGLAIGHRKLLWCSSKAGLAQLEERELPKLGVAGQNPVAHSRHLGLFLADLALFWRQMLWQRKLF